MAFAALQEGEGQDQDHASGPQQQIDGEADASAALGAGAQGGGAGPEGTDGGVGPPSMRTKLRQLLVTLSPKLAASTAAYLRDVMTTYRSALVPAPPTPTEGQDPSAAAAAGAPTAGGAGTTITADQKTTGGGGAAGSSLSALVDDVEAAAMFGALPEKLSDVGDERCPLVLDLRRCMAMLDASLEEPFAAAQRRRAAAAREAAADRRRKGPGGGGRKAGGVRTAGQVDGEGNEDEEDAWEDAIEEWEEAEGRQLGHGGQQGTLRQGPGAAAGAGVTADVPLVEVDYDRFADGYWPHFSSELTKSIG